MLWKLIVKIARLYALIALSVIGLMLASDKIVSVQPGSGTAMLSMFFPYGVLAGLTLSFFFMKLGGWITLSAVAGFYLTSYWQSGLWSQNDLPLILAGPAPIFLLAHFFKSLGARKRKDK